MSFLVVSWFSIYAFSWLFNIKPGCTYFLFFTRFLKGLFVHFLDEINVANLHISYTTEKLKPAVSQFLSAAPPMSVVMLVELFVCAFRRKMGIGEHHLRWISFLYSMHTNMKEIGCYSKSSFCAVKDIILSTFLKEWNGCTD